MKYRATLRTPVVLANDKIDAPAQTFHATLESARNWARKVIAVGATVEIYEITETLVDTVKP